MKTLLVLILVCWLAGCASADKNPNSYSEFPTTKELKGTVIELDTALFRYPFRLRIEKDLAVVLDLHNIDYYYHLFSFPEFRYLNSFGKRGNGPNEVLSAENVRIINGEAWGLDANKRELRRWSLKTPEDSVPLIATLSLDAALLRPLDFVNCRDSIVIPDYSGENRLCWVDQQGELIRKSGKIPTVNEKMLENSPAALAQAWRSFVDYNPRNQTMVLVTQLGEVMELYSPEEGQKVIPGPNGEPIFKQVGEYATPAGIMGFSDVQVTDRYIYAVFHGQTFKELMARMQAGKTPVDGGEFIYVFDLQGTPVCRYKLDHYIYGISVNEEEGTIYATDVNVDQPIIRYRME